MIWQVWIIIVALAILAFAIFRKKYKGGKNLFSIKPLRNKIIQFATPKKLEIILIAFAIISAMWFDVTKNQTLSFGMNYRVTWFGNISSSSYILAQIMLLVYLVILLTLFVMSLKSKKTNNVYDYFFGGLAILAFGILMTAFFYEFYQPTISFLGVDLSTTSFHHIGILISGVYILYLTFTA